MLNKRFNLFCDYINELKTIESLPLLTKDELEILYMEYISSGNMQWIDIFADSHNKTPIGFLMIGYPPNCHPDADFYIEEAYIAPSHRRKGYMSSAVTHFIKTNEGTYCLFILRSNVNAKKFWFRLFTELGYSSIFLRDVGAGDEHCILYGFEKDKAKK